jgi:hypothetical protein
MHIFSGTNSIGDDAYFLRLSDRKECYIHPEGDNPKNTEEVIYRVKEGLKGAGIWHKEQALELLKEIGAPNVELVKVSELIKDTTSKN